MTDETTSDPQAPETGDLERLELSLASASEALAEAEAELDKHNAPAAQSLALRIRSLVREQVKAGVPSEDAVAEMMDRMSALKPTGAPLALRRRLPDDRYSWTHHFDIAGHDGYLIVGMYADGSPGEIFIRMAKEGSTVGGLVDSIALGASMALQHGVPLKKLCTKYIGLQFEPCGFTSNPAITPVRSVVDYVFRWMWLKFLPGEIPAEILEGRR